MTECGKMFLKCEKDIGVLVKGRKHKHAKYGNNDVNNNTEDVKMMFRLVKKGSMQARLSQASLGIF